MTLRVLAAAAVFVSAVVHLTMWLDYARDEHLLGPAFLLNAAGGAVIGVLVLAWRHRVTAFPVLGFGLGTLAAFVAATTVGLFGTSATWDGWEVWTAAVAEVLAILAGALILLQCHPPRSGGEPQHHSSPRRAHLD